MKRKIVLYILFLITVLFIILSADESRRPLILTGDNLRRETGAVDGTSLTIAADSGYSGRLAYTWNYMLEAGSYRIGIEYRTDTADNTLYIHNNGSAAVSHCLNPSFTYEEIPLILEKDSQEILFEFFYNGTGTLNLNSLQITPEGRFYQDAFFLIALFLLANIIGVFLYRSKYFQTASLQSKMILFGLLAIAFVSSIPLMNGALNWADDLCYHLARIEGLKDGLADGQLPVVIYPEGLYGNGYLNCMYPNLFLYIPAVIRLFGVSMAASYKFLIILFHILTVWITYSCVKSVSDSRKAALLAAILYALCPYRFTNLYARGALGEFLAMTFMPLLLAGLYHTLLGNRRKYWMLVLGVSGLIQTHVLSAVIGAAFCILFGILCLATVIHEKRYFEILKSIFLTLFLNLWFIVPFVYFYKKGGLWTSALDWCTYSEYSLNLSGLFGALNLTDYRTLSLGLPISFCAAVCLFAVCFTGKKDLVHRFCVTLFVLGCICTFMVTSQFPGWLLMNIGIIEFLFKNIQFAWRLLGPASILFVFAGCVLLYRLDVMASYRKGIFLALTAVTLLSAVHYQPEDFAYQDYNDTTTVGHHSKLRGIPRGDNTIVYPFEWRPQGTIEADLTTTPVFSVPSSVTVHEFTKNGTNSILEYTAMSSDQTVSFPLIYYAGYHAADENGQELAITPNPENNTIQIALNGDGQLHRIEVKYKGLKSFTAAFLISLLSAGILLYRLLHTYTINQKHDKGVFHG